MTRIENWREFLWVRLQFRVMNYVSKSHFLSKRLFSSLTLVWHLAGGGSYNALVMYSILSLSLFLSRFYLCKRIVETILDVVVAFVLHGERIDKVFRRLGDAAAGLLLMIEESW